MHPRWHLSGRCWRPSPLRRFTAVQISKSASMWRGGKFQLNGYHWVILFSLSFFSYHQIINASFVVQYHRGFSTRKMRFHSPHFMRCTDREIKMYFKVFALLFVRSSGEIKSYILVLSGHSFIVWEILTLGLMP